MLQILNKSIDFNLIICYINNVRNKNERKNMKVIYKQDKDFDGYVIGIFEEKDGSYLALTATKSKNFKTLNGAKKFIEKYTGLTIGVIG